MVSSEKGEGRQMRNYFGWRESYSSRTPCTDDWCRAKSVRVNDMPLRTADIRQCPGQKLAYDSSIRVVHLDTVLGLCGYIKLLHLISH